MSATTSRPEIQSVSGAGLAAVTAGGALLAAALISSLVSSLGSAGRRAYERTITSAPQKAPDTLKPVTALRNERRARRQQAVAPSALKDLTQVEALKVSTLASIAATPYLTGDSPLVRQQLAEVCKAGSVAALRQAETSLLQTLEGEHHRLFVRSLTLACANAAMKVGFKAIQMTTGPSGEARVIASDSTGRSLVTEISADPERDTNIATEVVGVADGSCTTILDAFDKALEEEGVRASAPRRKYTGGVCELAAARDFVRGKVKRASASDQPHDSESAGVATRRSQRLNQKARQKAQ
jgi:hypothetical protein